MAPPKFVESVGTAQAALGKGLMDVGFARTECVASKLMDAERRVHEMFAESARVAEMVDRSFTRTQDMLSNSVQATSFASADSVASKLMGAERRVHEMFAESARVAEMVDRSFTRTQDMLSKSVQAADIALAGSAAYKLMEEERRFTEMLAEPLNRAERTYARVEASLSNSVRAAESALTGSAASKLFEEERRLREMFAESTRVADLLGGVNCAAAVAEAALGKHIRAGNQLTARLGLLRMPASDLPDMSVLQRTDGEADALPRFHRDIEADEDFTLSTDPAFWAALILLATLAALVSMIDVLTAQPVAAWDNAVLLLRVIDLWEPDPAISGLCKLIALLEVLRRIWRRRQ